eukprot:gb/GECG01009629.1/.p1 GENE.gb/GECG01009629.1/~~gb/GECG01009629.1/.p1  ORF type:complete len:2167 (+),score=175.40 gb/GECG01009629.1/:1-6501(+)
MVPARVNFARNALYCKTSGLFRWQRWSGPAPFALVLCSVVCAWLVFDGVVATGQGGDLRDYIIGGNAECIHYDSTFRMFYMNCSITWTDTYDEEGFISLGANETFEGNDHEVDLGGAVTQGIFETNVKTLASFSEAPLIRNLRTTGGIVEQGGGFLMKKSQRYFRIHSCSSSGTVEGGGGGICGMESGSEGRIEIIGCHSTATLERKAGGISGAYTARNGGVALIQNCSFSGTLGGTNTGGICGSHTGANGGLVSITRSFSTSDIQGEGSGGIVGTRVGDGSGFVFIGQCYSFGNIGGTNAGGITGSHTSSFDGYVLIKESYSHGTSQATGTGGICGAEAGGFGFLFVIDSYAAGGATGISGRISLESRKVHVLNCVYTAAQLSKGARGPDFQAGNSNDLGSITHTLLKDESGTLLWSEESWVANATEGGLPLLRFQVEDSVPPVKIPSWDLRDSIMDGKFPCLSYSNDNKTFSIRCDINWTDTFDVANFISLKTGELFDGNHHVIDLANTIIFPGIFRIEPIGIASMSESPRIRNIRTRGSETSHGGGFIVRQGQNWFHVDSCESTGRISGKRSGGIVGSSLDESNGAQIEVWGSTSSGDIVGASAGGIIGAGRSGSITILQCYSTGEIVGAGSGGIAGDGITGVAHVAQCYSKGQVAGYGSGGICGSNGGRGDTGTLSISDSYSLGDIMGDRSGGILGDTAGASQGTVILENVYAVGELGTSTSGAGLIGFFDSSTSAILITNSVYRPPMFIGNDNLVDVDLRNNSATFDDINGTLYSVDGVLQWSPLTWVVIGSTQLPILRFQLPTPTASPSTTPLATSSSLPSASCPPSSTASITLSPTGSVTHTSTSSSSASYPPSSTVTGTTSSSPTGSSTHTGSNSVSASSSPSSVVTNTMSPSPSHTDTSAASTSPTVIPAAPTTLAYSSSVAPSRTSGSTSSVSPWVAATGSTTPSMSMSATPLEESQARNDVQPRQLHVKYSRDSTSASSVVLRVVVTVTLGTTVEWQISGSALGESLVSLPPKKQFYFPGRKRAVGQQIVLHLAELGAGDTTVTTVATFSHPRMVSSTLIPVNVNVTVFQANPAVESSIVDVALSKSEDSATRSYQIFNFGSHLVTWDVELFGERDRRDSVTGVNPWLSVSSEVGTVEPQSKTSTLLHFFPHNVVATGEYEAWMLIRTNAWDSNHLQGSEELPPESILSLASSTAGLGTVHFWVRIRLSVSSVYVCALLSNLVIEPSTTAEARMTVVNTDKQEVTVSFSDFSLEPIDQSAGKKSLSAQKAIPLSWSLLPNRTVQLAPWMYLFPSVVHLKRGLNKDVSIQVGYPSVLLPVVPLNETVAVSILPGKYRLSFSSSTFLGGDSTHSQTGSARHMITFEDVPGIPHGDKSSLKISKTKALVGEPIQAYVELKDEFGYGPTHAIFSNLPFSEGETNFVATTVPLIRIVVGVNADVNTEAKVILPKGLQNGNSITSLGFKLIGTSAGIYSVDVTLDGQSIDGSPRNVSIETVNCERPHEILHVSGRHCVCQAGFHRDTNAACVACSPGTFQEQQNNASACPVCPRNTFAESGSTVCYRCPSDGVSCAGGRLQLEKGVWCEVCDSEPDPRMYFIQDPSLLFDVVFHDCEPANSCNVNASSFSTSCSEGYTGPACRTCKSGYSRKQDGPCVKCDDGHFDTFIFAVSVLLLLSFVVIISLKAHRDVQSFSVGISLSKYGDPGLHSDVKSLHHAVLLVLDYLQICAIVSTMKINPFKGVASGFSDVSSLGTVSPARASSFQCLTHLSPTDTTLVIMASPLLVILIVVAMQALIDWLIVRRDGQPFSRTLWFQSSAVAVIQVLNLVHMSVTDATLRSFEVYQHKIHSSRRAALDLNVDTRSREYRTLVVVATLSLAIFVIGYPLVVAIYYIIRSWKVTSRAVATQFSRMTGGYRIQRYGFLWDVVVIMRKVALLIVAVWVSAPVEQFLISTTVLLFSFAMSAFLSPYRSSAVMILQRLMIFLSCVNCLLGLQLGIVDPLESDASRSSTTFFPSDIKRVVVVLQSFFFASAALVWLYLSPRAADAARRILSTRCQSFLLQKRTVNKRIAETKLSLGGIQSNPLLVHKSGSEAVTTTVSRDSETPIEANHLLSHKALRYRVPKQQTRRSLKLRQPVRVRSGNSSRKQLVAAMNGSVSRS